MNFYEALTAANVYLVVRGLGGVGERTVKMLHEINRLRSPFCKMTSGGDEKTVGGGGEDSERDKSLCFSCGCGGW